MVFLFGHCIWALFGHCMCTVWALYGHCKTRAILFCMSASAHVGHNERVRTYTFEPRRRRRWRLPAACTCAGDAVYIPRTAGGKSWASPNPYSTWSCECGNRLESSAERQHLWQRHVCKRKLLTTTRAPPTSLGLGMPKDRQKGETEEHTDRNRQADRDRTAHSD